MKKIMGYFEIVVTEKTMRPASSNRECYYCKQPIGEEHKSNCVMRSDNYTPCTVYIKNINTGNIKAIAKILYTPIDHDGLFIWSDGNFSCDCNRAILCGEDSACGEWKYKVNIEVNGKIIYREFQIEN